MRRFWVSPHNIKNSKVLNSKVLLEGDTFHHIFHVCRLQKKQKTELFYGKPTVLLVEITDIQSNKARTKVIEKRPLPPLQKPWIHLAISLPKLSTFEAILERSVELDVHSLHPFLSERSFFKSKNKLSSKDKQGGKNKSSLPVNKVREEKFSTFLHLKL